MIRRITLAFCAAAVIASGATVFNPTDANAEFSISVGDYGDYRSYRYRNFGEDDYGGRNYRSNSSRHYHGDDDHDHDCGWVYRQVPSYHWHDGHYGRHGYQVKRVWVCDND